MENGLKAETDSQTQIVDELKQIDHFFSQLKEPQNLDDIRERVLQFCQNNQNSRIVLITVSVIDYKLYFNDIYIYSNLINCVNSPAAQLFHWRRIPFALSTTSRPELEVQPLLSIISYFIKPCFWSTYKSFNEP